MIITNLYNTIIKCKNKGAIDTPFTITISLLDYEEEYVIGKNLPVNLIKPNGGISELHSGIGGQPMDYVLQFTPTVHGLYTIECNHTKKQFYIGGLKKHQVSNKISLYYNETKVILNISGTFSSTKDKWVNIATIPTDLAPDNLILFKGYSKKCDFYVNASGVIYYRNWENTGNITEIIQSNWSRKL